MTKRTKAVLILVSILTISYIAYKFNKPISLGEIELKLGSQNLSEAETQNLLDEVIHYFATKEPSSSEKLKIDSTIVINSFLTKTDLSFIEKILDIERQSPAADNKSFFADNKIRLYGLVFKLARQVVYLRYKHPERIQVIHQYEELANRIASQFENRLNSTFPLYQLKFLNQIEKEHLEEKLKLEAYYKKFYELHFQDPKGAIIFLGSGLKLAQKLGDKKREIDFLSRLQFILSESFGMTSIGLALGNYLLSETNTLGYEIKKALVLYYNGNVLIAKGQFRQALKQYEMSKGLYSKFDFQDLLRINCERMGVAHRRLGQFDLALQSYKKSLQFSTNPNEPAVRIRYQQGLGAIYAEMGHYTKAENAYSESLQLAKKVKDKQLEATALIALGVLSEEIGDYKKSLEFHQKALAELRIEGTPFLIADIWSRLTKLHAKNDEIEKAKRAAANAIEHLSKFDFGLPKARTLLNIGELQMQIGDLEPALESLNQSLQIFKELEVITSRVGTLNLIGETHRRLGSYKLALETLNKASDLAATLPYKSDTYFYFARVYKDLHRIESAEDYLQKSIAAVKQIGSNLVNHEQRYNFSQKIQPLFEEMVLLQLTKGDSRAAFYYAEEGRAQVLKVLLQDKFNKQPKQVTMNAALSLNLPQSNEKHEQMILNLQNSLDEHTVLVEYEMTDSSMVSWIISRDNFHVEQIPVARKKMENLIQEFRVCTIPDSLETSRQINTSFQKTKMLGQLFYEYLISPIQKFLDGAELVYFVPDEVLNHLPFAAIRTPDDKYLLSDFAITVIPSANILQTILLREKSESKKLLAIAANKFLKHSFEEAREVAKLQPNSKLLVGSHITERIVKDELSETPYSTLLFSNYGQIDEKKPYNSALLLNKDRESFGELENDGFLRVYEIQEMDLSSMDLVFLSACETASGQLYRGEGIVGMQRAFLVAGANSVIANLWKIDDKAAKDLTVDFFKKWLTGKQTKAEALRQAQLKMIEQLEANPKYGFAHPYFWAASTLTGLYY